MSAADVTPEELSALRINYGSSKSVATMPLPFIVRDFKKILDALDSARAKLAASPVDQGMPKDREELQKLLDGAYKRGNHDAHEAHRIAEETGLKAACAPVAVEVPDVVLVPHDGYLLVGSEQARRDRHNVVGCYFDRLGNLQEIREGSMYDSHLKRLPRLGIDPSRILKDGERAVPVALDRGVGTIDMELVRIGYAWLDHRAGKEVCNNRTCIRCRLADILAQVENEMALRSGEAGEGSDSRDSKGVAG